MPLFWPSTTSIMQYNQINTEHRRWPFPSDREAKLFEIAIIGRRDQHELDVLFW